MIPLTKKAITPLMITMLLVSFAVAVGNSVMKFGQAQVEEGAECALDIKLKLSTIGGKEQLCSDAATRRVSFTVENGVNTDVQGLLLSIIGTQKAETFELAQAKMTKAGSYVGTVPYDSSDSGPIRQVKITPKIPRQEGELICAEQAIVREQITAC